MYYVRVKCGHTILGIPERIAVEVWKGFDGIFFGSCQDVLIVCQHHHGGCVSHQPCYGPHIRPGSDGIRRKGVPKIVRSDTAVYTCPAKRCRPIEQVCFPFQGNGATPRNLGDTKRSAGGILLEDGAERVFGVSVSVLLMSTGMSPKPDDGPCRGASSSVSLQ